MLGLVCSTRVGIKHYKTTPERTIRTRARTREQDPVVVSSDDDAWEDMIEPNPSPLKSNSRSSSPAGSIRSQSSRKRKGAAKTVFVAGPRRQSTTPSPAKTPRRKSITPPVEPASTRLTILKEEFTDAVSHGAVHTLKYGLDVFKTSVSLLRRPLSFLLFLWILAAILARMNRTLRVAFAPLCIIPGISNSRFCLSDYSHHDQGPPEWADYPRLVEVQSATFEQLLDGSVGGSGLALEIKKAEMATVDLSTLVRVSNLKSRDLIAESLSEFVKDAKKTGRGLQKLSSKVGGAVDGILAVNDHALHTIEGAISNTPSKFSLMALVPFTASRKPTKEVVAQTFTEAMDVLGAFMRRLIVEAEISLTNLNNLEERLSTLHELVSREDSSLSTAKSELLAELWTKVGGNRQTLRGYDDHLFLLKNLGDYRSRALLHVVTALQTLQAMSEDMEDLRERVAAPELVGSSIPVEVHMRSIQGGLERLKEGRIKAKEREEEAFTRMLTDGV